jgi:hydroxyacylglutathione hydrolase
VGSILTTDVFPGGAFGENGYVVVGQDGVSAVVVDPGASADVIAAHLAEQALELQAILLTHAHLDHVEGINTILAQGPGTPIHLHPADLGLYQMAPEQAASFGLSIDTPPPPDLELTHGQRFEFGGSEFEVRHAPGHAPGHVIFYAAAAGIALVGDVVFAGSIGRTDLPGGDFRTLMTSIREQVLTLPDETRLLTGHGPETTVGFERVGNPFLVPHYGGELA